LNGFWTQQQMGIAIFLGVLLAIALTNLRALRRLGDFPAPSQFPTVSVLVPARNEASAIGPCLRSLLSQDYPAFEVVVLDDESDDETGEMLAALAAEDPRLRVLQGQPLPEGWIGKHWACHQLAEAAQGDLFLFTDADTAHSPQALRRAVGALEAEGADLLTALPWQELGSWGERLCIPVAYWSVFSLLPVGLAHRLRLPGLSVGNGQFLLFRREAYQAVGGHEAVRANPVDDIALAQRIKAQGFCLRLVDATGEVRCRMYRGWREILEGFSKNLFAVFQFRLLEHVFAWCWLLLVAWQPWVALIWNALGGEGSPFLTSRALVALAEGFALWGIVLWRFRFPLSLLPLYPFSMLAFWFIAMRSVWVTVRGQAMWKERRLPPQPERWL
jgi:chlorobactene glucosyltransferase